jgi:ubiquinone/menaquinone biosynthesis C-methylase UbiE
MFSDIPKRNYAGRWGRLVAREFLKWLAVPDRGHWLDVGCGTGALTEIILAAVSPTSVLGIDPAEPHFALARAHVRDPNASFDIGSAMVLSARAGTYDAAVGD